MLFTSTSSLPFSSVTKSVKWVQHVNDIKPRVLERWKEHVTGPVDLTWFGFVGDLGLGKMTTQVELLYALRCADTDFEKGLAYGRWHYSHSIKSEVSANESGSVSHVDRHFSLIESAIAAVEDNYDELIDNHPEFLKEFVPFSGMNASLEKLALGIAISPTDFSCGLLSSWFLAGLQEREKCGFSEFSINALERFNPDV